MNHDNYDRGRRFVLSRYLGAAMTTLMDELQRRFQAQELDLAAEQRMAGEIDGLSTLVTARCLGAQQ